MEATHFFFQPFRPSSELQIQKKLINQTKTKTKLSKLNTMLMLNDFMQTITNNFKIWWTDAFIKDEKRFKF